jgi:hypothetical protein
MTAEVVSVVTRGIDAVEITVRRGEDLTEYTLTRVDTPILQVLDHDSRFHTDFRDTPDARMAMFDVARSAVRGAVVELPLRLPES